jgi:hypothetical protein
MDTRWLKVSLALLAMGFFVAGTGTIALAKDYHGYVDNSYPSSYNKVPNSKGEGWMHTDNAGWIHTGKLGPDTTKPAEGEKGFVDQSYPKSYNAPPDLSKNAMRSGQGAGNVTASAHSQTTQQAKPMVKEAK